jgi:hypothetical protein
MPNPVHITLLHKNAELRSIEVNIGNDHRRAMFWYTKF